MKTIYLTEKTDENTATWYLTEHGDLLEASELDEYPGAIAAKVISHGMFVGSQEDFATWVLNEAKDRL
jgi:hypothetical protein